MNRPGHDSKPCEVWHAPDRALEALLHEWEQRRRDGLTPTAEEICPDDPVLCERLRLQILRRLRSEGPAEATILQGEAERSSEAFPTAPPGYVLHREVGRGGMGVVYLAHHRRLNRPTALKMARGRLTNPQQLARFLVEGEALAAVRHPHVVPVYECGEHDGQPFLAMEYLEGGTLADRLERVGRFPPEAAARLVLKLARGVEAAHRQGVIHRDLKPSNVLFDAAGEPKVGDFGLAKRAGSPDLTTTQMTMGTPAYMSPEQARGQAKYAGPPTDVYALGVILYECLSGSPPFVAEREFLLLDKVIREPPASLRARVPHVARDLEVICLKCLHKEPARRYASAGELADDLDRFLRSVPICARPAGRAERASMWVKRHPQRATLAAAVLLAAIVALTGLVAHQREVAETEARQQVATLESASLEAIPGLRPRLEERRPLTEPLLRQRLAEARSGISRNPKAELHAALVLATWDDAEQMSLVEQSLTGTPALVRAVRPLLDGARHAELREQLRARAEAPERPRAERLRALALIAGPEASVSARTADELAGQLLQEDRLHLAEWTQALEPVRAALLAPLERQYRRGRDSEAGIGAALVLREYLKGQEQRMPPLIEEGGVRQAALLGVALGAAPEAVTLLRRAWAPRSLVPPVQGPDDTFDGNDVIDAEERRRSRVGLALIAAGQGELVWPALAERDAPRLRTYLIHDFAASGLPPPVLQGALAACPDAAVRQAVYLAWGELPPDRWGTAELAQVVSQVERDFVEHPDPGVHSAARWLLTRWCGEERGRALSARLPSARERGPRRWFVNAHGQTFAVVPGPTEVAVGTPWNEWGWHSSEPYFGPERAHRRRIARTFAIATTETTWGQAQAFLRDCRDHLARLQRGPEPFGKCWSSRTDDSPMVGLNWYQAALYCRWLSEQEQVPEDQMCYPPLGAIGPGMTVPADYLRRTGYRLPTEAEWECACRAGSTTRHCSGSDEELLGQYAWYQGNARRRTHPVGQLKPNALGLFDIHGNAFEWCGVREEPYPEIDMLGVLTVGETDERPCHDGDRCVLRGGDFSERMQRQRSAHRTVVARDNRWPASGLRVARTIAAPGLDAFLTEETGSGSCFAVCGEPGTYRVVRSEGDVTFLQGDRTIPGTLEAVVPRGAVRSYAFTLERVESGETVRVAETSLPLDWQVRWFAWPPSPERPDRRPSPVVWADAVRGRPLYEGRASRLSWSWKDRHPLPGVRHHHCGLVATTEVELPAGRYQFEATGLAHGFQVTLDGEPILHDSWTSSLACRTAERSLAAGRHRLQVEYWVTYGDAAFEFQLRRN